ncbi:hypothetical protein PHLGIDRAFT_459944 [Phlebiopsis gigantea 11061_1 CR5-6]|uniref:RNI-like protein n=1 Tax=Phlebiopsis gigantea (strain 11061_1 CR5-6) TaxID=745531 RepID=A0A0C3RXD2_PHLG1|nr:hypothetical protein PHLGIDRAFT_459944 [Phlebiopsis gigantea 11061_1 CR5-6]
MFGLPGQNDRHTVYISLDNVLHGIEGAREIFNLIVKRSLVTGITLNHHRLGDEGVEELCRLLSLPNSSRYRHHISRIDLGDNCMTDKGLEAISSYLLDNRRLKEVILQNNHFTWEQNTLSHFVTAINSSCLGTLTLNTTPRGDVSVPYILAHLTTPYLKTLRLAITQLTASSVPHIVDFISSSRCRLRTLVLSGNLLQLHGLNTLIAAMSDNFTLCTVDIYGNSEISGDTTHIYALKKAVEDRNRVLQECVARQALVLLRTSRVLLLQARAPRPESACSSSSSTSSSSSSSVLPMELQQHILSFNAPHLSTTQHLCIFNFASDPSTLPPLDTERHAPCLADPSAMPSDPLSGPPRLCENGTCMGAMDSISCKRENIKDDWLISVGCDVPDPTAMTDKLLREL